MKRMQAVLKDEQGLTLVELLAVVVILGIIATIGAVGIGQIIQNSREDARVGDLQQAMSAAQMYNIQNGDKEIKTSDGITAKKLSDTGLLKNVQFKDGTKISFTKDAGEKQNIKMSVAAGAVEAGSKVGKEFVTTENKIGDLNRDEVFGAASSGGTGG